MSLWQASGRNGGRDDHDADVTSALRGIAASKLYLLSPCPSICKLDRTISMVETMEEKPSKPSLRAKANKIRILRCKNLIAVIENPEDIRNIGAVVRNVNALGVEKAYIVTNKNIIPDDWEVMRNKANLIAYSASAIKWSFVKTFPDTEKCLDHLEKNGFTSIVTSPHVKGKNNIVLHEANYTKYKKLAVWFGNEKTGISALAIERSAACVSIPMVGIIESLNLGTSSGIVLYEITKQRRKFQERLAEKVAEKTKSNGSV